MTLVQKSSLTGTRIFTAIKRGLPLFALACMFGVNAAQAADDFDQGMASFKARNYTNASAAFRRAIVARAGDPNLPNIFYYYALSLHYSKDEKLAKLAYLEIISRWPGSPAAGRAQQGLNLLAPGLLASASAGGRSSSSPSSRVQSYGSHSSGSSGVGGGGGTNPGDIIPLSSSANFDMVNGHMVVDVAFNGRRTKAIFDTGAEMVLIGKNHLAEIGLSPPTGGATAQSRGVGGRVEDVTAMPLDVTVAGVTRKNLTCYISEHMDTLPLLGLPFVKGMNYAVEDSSIRFNSKTATAFGAGTDYNAVPYTMQGHTMLVRAKVNGKDTLMCLDSGAASTLFTKAQATALGINVENEAITNLGSGVDGAVTGRYTVLNSLALGPIQHRDFRIGVNEENHSPYPLLGKDFWEGHRWSVDEDKHLIHFN